MENMATSLEFIVYMAQEASGSLNSCATSFSACAKSLGARVMICEISCDLSRENAKPAPCLRDPQEAHRDPQGPCEGGPFLGCAEGGAFFGGF